MARIRVALVRPENPANVGASARVVRNTGGDGLDLVAPGDWRTVECWRTAWGAQDILEAARVFPSLEAALEGTALAVALTRRPGGGSVSIGIREATREIVALRLDETAVLVFGPEASGLTNEELAVCGRRAYIPANPIQPSFNLSHAVAIASHEVYSALRRPPGPGPRRATHEEKERLLVLLKDGLLALGALPRANAERRFRDWQNLIHRSDVTPREVKLLEHMARRMASPAGRR
jgi:TrmH family RNA methyltransferase